MLNVFIKEGSIVKLSRGHYDFVEGFTPQKCFELHKENVFKSNSDKMQALWQNENYRNKQSAAHVESSTKLWQNSEYREKTTKACQEVWTKDKRQQQSDIVKNAMSFEQVKQNMSAGQTKRWSNESERLRQKQAMITHYESKEAHEITSKATKAALSSDKARLNISIKTKEGQQKHNAYQKISAASINMWKNPETINKIHLAKKKNASYGLSSQHKFCLNWLKSKGLTVEVEKQYPNNATLHCDAFVKELDLWIEFHYHWSHGNEPFDDSSIQHAQKVDALACKAIEHRQKYCKKRSQYDAAIYTWTNVDVRKRQCAECNKLNYQCFYSMQEFFDYFEKVRIDSKTLYPWDNYTKVLQASQQIKLSGHNCIVKEIDSKTSKDFLEAYHYQGSLKTIKDVRVSLYYKDELVALATFGKPRYNSSYEWEALRYCVKSGYSIIGGAKKLYKYFEQMYKPKSIVSYQDLSKFQGTFHEMLEYSYLSEQKSYHWYSFSTGQHFTDNLVRQLGVDKLLGTNFGKPEICGLTNDELLHHIGFIKVLDEGQRTYVKFFNKGNNS